MYIYMIYDIEYDFKVMKPQVSPAFKVQEIRERAATRAAELAPVTEVPIKMPSIGCIIIIHIIYMIYDGLHVFGQQDQQLVDRSRWCATGPTL